MRWRMLVVAVALGWFAHTQRVTSGVPLQIAEVVPGMNCASLLKRLGPPLRTERGLDDERLTLCWPGLQVELVANQAVSIEGPSLVQSGRYLLHSGMPVPLVRFILGNPTEILPTSDSLPDVWTYELPQGRLQLLIHQGYLTPYLGSVTLVTPTHPGEFEAAAPRLSSWLWPKNPRPLPPPRLESGPSSSTAAAPPSPAPTRTSST